MSINHDGLVKSSKIPFSVIPADPGSGLPRTGYGVREESSLFKQLQAIWTPVFTGVTTFYECINHELKKIEMKLDLLRHNIID